MLAVSTVTLNRRPDWLRECVASVDANLPAGARHLIVDGADFQRAKWETTQADEYFAWVDDDDLVCGDALRLCVAALEQTGAAVAFTFEQKMDADGVDLAPAPTDKVDLLDVAMHPRSLHHLAVMRRAALDPQVLELALHFGLGIDWLCRAWCALRHGAVQVPVVGYRWRQHNQQPLHRMEGDRYFRAMSAIQKHLLSWMTHNETVRRVLPR